VILAAAFFSARAGVTIVLQKFPSCTDVSKIPVHIKSPRILLLWLVGHCGLDCTIVPAIFLEFCVLESSGFFLLLLCMYVISRV